MIGDQTALLLDRARSGDAEAQENLLERLRPRLELWCASRMSAKLRAKVQPEDAAQEVLLAIHTALPTFEDRGRQKFLGWVFRIAERRIIGLAKHHGALKRKTVPPRWMSQTSPSAAAARSSRIASLRTALDELREDDRLVIRLRRLEERSFEEIAEIMERSPEAARKLYGRALEQLRRLLSRSGAPWRVDG